MTGTSNPFDVPPTTKASTTNPFDGPATATPAATPFSIATPQVGQATVKPGTLPTPVIKQAQPVDAGFDATPWGMVTNALKAVVSGDAALPAAQKIGEFAQGVARFPLEIVNSLNEAVQRVTSYTGGNKNAFTETLPNYQDIPTKAFGWVLGDENLGDSASKVASLEDSIKNSTFAQQNGWDRYALPLAFGTVVGGDTLNFLGGGEEGKAAFEATVEHLVKETDPSKIFDYLVHNGIDAHVASEAAPHLANSVDPTEVGNTLKAIEAVQGVVDKQVAPGTPTVLPDHVSVAETPVDVQTPSTPTNALQVQHGNPKLIPADRAIEAQAFAQIHEKGLDAQVDQYLKDNGNVISTDNARELYSAYRKDRTKSAAVHEPSSLVKNAAYDRLLRIAKGTRNNTVLATMGGTGAGKTTGLRAIGDRLDNYPIVLDSNFNKLGNAVKNIDKALSNDFKVKVQFTYNDIEKAYENAMGRAQRQAATEGTGRTLPIAEHIDTHLGSHEVFPQLFGRYFDNPNVEFVLIDNSGPKVVRVTDPEEMLALLDKKRYNGTYEDLVSTLARRTQNAQSEGRISAQTAHGFDPSVSTGSGSPGGTHERPALPRGSTVGQGAQARADQEAAAASAGRRTAPIHINDTVPLPDSVGTIIARNGWAIPIESTPAHALDALRHDPAAGSWQSIVKGFAYNFSPEKRAHWFDGLSTPEFVLEKVGLAHGAELLQDAKDQAASTVKKEIATVSDFIVRVKNQHKDGQVHTPADTSTLIFDWLDGHESVVTPYMSDNEIAVARDIRVYLKDWAQRLGLPEEHQIGKYITHIFERSPQGKPSKFASDPELSAIMAENVAKSVYDPFLQKRLGKQDYVHDVWRALDAYVKRASRKEAMDPALKELADMAEHLDQRTFNYVKDLSHKVNMRPTETEQGFDSFITQTPIGHYFTDRPTAYLSKRFRQLFYRGTLGLNLSSGLRNLSQGANTYAKLGEKYTILGYTKLFSHMAARDLAELYDHNVLGDSFIQDRQRGAIKKTMDMVDSTLFAHYTLSEMINRGAAYYGAKAQALAKGLGEEQAIKYAKRMVRETQFSFGAVDTPTWLNDDVKKTLFQLQTYNVKQAEFLGRMAKQKDIAGLVRYTAASFAMLYTIGRLFGMTASQIIPTIGIGGAPLTSTALAAAGLMSSDPQTHAKAVSQLQRNFISMIPAGAQIRKTLQGAADLHRGGDFTAKGKFRYRVGPENTTQALLFGPGALPQAQQYYSNLNTPKAAAGGANPFD